MTGNEDGYSQAIVVVPSDSVNFTAGRCHAIYVGGAGAVSAVVNGTTVVFAAVPVGTVLRVRASRINATGTTATNIVALY